MTARDSQRAREIAHEFTNGDPDSATGRWLEKSVLKALSEARAEGAGWQPIESAPKDGTLVDLWSDRINGRIPDVAWDAGMKTFGAWATPDDDDESPYFVPIYMAGVTHWCERPPPPPAASSAKEE